jgi:hypothetical protein
MICGGRNQTVALLRVVMFRPFESISTSIHGKPDLDRASLAKQSRIGSECYVTEGHYFAGGSL